MLTFDLVSDLVLFGRDGEDSQEVYGEIYYVQAESANGRRMVHEVSFPTKEKHFDPEDSCYFFADVRERALADAQRLLARIVARGTIDTTYWRETNPCYGSDAYVADMTEAATIAWERDIEATYRWAA